MQPGRYAAQAPPPRMRPAQVRPSKWWFVVAGVIAVVGVVAAVVVLVVGAVGYVDRIEGFDRADLPATLDVEITDTGGYSIYHEYDGADFSRFVSDPVVSVSDPAGDPVLLDRYDGSITYEAGGHEGEGLFTFDAKVPGTYEVRASGQPGSGIAVGRGLGRGLVVSVAGSLAIGLVAVVAGVVIAIVVGVKRSQNRRALRPAPGFGDWGPQPIPGAPGAYGPAPVGYGPGPAGYGPGPAGPGPADHGPGPAGPVAPRADGQPPPPLPPPPPVPTDAARPPDAPQQPPPTPQDAPPAGGS